MFIITIVKYMGIAAVNGDIVCLALKKRNYQLLLRTVLILTSYTHIRTMLPHNS